MCKMSDLMMMTINSDDEEEELVSSEDEAPPHSPTAANPLDDVTKSNPVSSSPHLILNTLRWRSNKPRKRERKILIFYVLREPNPQV